MSARCTRCGTSESKHTKDCYEAMILGWALGIEERVIDKPEPVLVDRNPALASEIAELRDQVATLTLQLERAKEQSGQWYDDWRKLYAAVQDGTAAPTPPEWEQPPPAPEEVSSPEPEPTAAESAAILAENVRDLLGAAAAAEGSGTAEPVVAEAEPSPAPRPARTGPAKTPSAAVEHWLNEEAVASNSDDARIIVATAPEVYAAWAADKPDMPDTATPLTIAKALKGRGYKRRAPLINGRQYPAYYGVRLRTPEPEPDGSVRETRPEEEVAVVERFVTARTRPSSEPDALVATGDMYASYQRWCERTGQADVGRENFSTCMQQLGAYEKGQLWRGPRKKILGYIGAELTPEPLAGSKPNEVPDNQTIRKAIAAARAAAKKAHDEREAAEKEAATPPPVEYRVKTPEPKAKPDNNGWGKTFDTSEVVVPELSVEDVLAEHAEIEPRGGYTGPRPGSGDKLDDETRDLINAILNLDEGWEFQPPQRGQSHSFLRAPDGSRFRQASTMGGSVGRVGNNRELRRFLSRKGMLPTAASPASLLVSAKAAKPKPKPKPPVKVIGSGDSRQPGEERIQVSAEPDAKPLTEEEMDATLFDLFVEVRAGYDGPFSYHPDVESLQGLNKDEISTAVRQPERVEVRPESKAKGYPVLKFSRGDVNVIMGFRDRATPAVIRAEWGWLLGADTYQVDRHGGGGSKSANSLPNNYTQLAGRLKNLGAEITPNADGKTAAVSYKGQNLGLVTKEKCPRTTTHSDWNRMQRKITAISRRELAAV